ncbi:MAG TPA: hypothetical protein VIJ38_01725 [Acidobacteriaceae bacterium]
MHRTLHQAAAYGLLALLAGCASVPAPTPSLPHRPMSQIDLQGHPPEWVLAITDDCPGHVAEVLLAEDGNIFLLCRPALLLVIP